MWHHTQTTHHRLTRPLTEHVKRFVVDTAAVDPGKVYVAGQAVSPEPFMALQSSRNGQAEVLFVASSRSARASPIVSTERPERCAPSTCRPDLRPIAG
jgi:hypothetical protein